MLNTPWTLFSGKLVYYNGWEKSSSNEEITILDISNYDKTISTIVDSNIVDELRKHHWYVNNENPTTLPLLHNYVIKLNNKTNNKAQYISHINQNTLDNRYENLRWVETPACEIPNIFMVPEMFENC